MALDTASASPAKPVRLELRTLTATRRTLARAMRAYAEGHLDANRYRDLLEGISALTPLLLAEREGAKT